MDGSSNVTSSCYLESCLRTTHGLIDEVEGDFLSCEIPVWRGRGPKICRGDSTNVASAVSKVWWRRLARDSWYSTVLKGRLLG